jgi:hypothetical protein
MVGILNNKKRVFWEALLLTVVIFIFGILIGIAYEASKSSQVSDYYTNSEISLMDVFALNSMISLNSQDCSVLTEANLQFADRIYKEAVLLEKYESAGKVTKEIQIVHERYDILRTFLWINNIETSQKCKENYSTVVYLYEYNSKDLAQKARQNVWSKILYDLKQKEGSKILLIPIAADSNLTSLDSLTNKFNITKYPVVVINEKDVIYDLTSVEQLSKDIN